MQLRLAVCTFSVLILTAAAWAGTANPPTMTITVDAKSVTVSGVPPGDSVVLFSCSRLPHKRSIAVRPDAVVLNDDDRDGIVALTPAEGVSRRSVWVAVDQTTGDTATAAAPDYPLYVAPLPGDGLKRDSEGGIAELAIELPRLSLLLVRPRTGAWMMTAFDGEASDHDGNGNGRVELQFESARTVAGKEKAPKHLKKGDTVVGIDPGHLDVFVGRIDQ